MLAPSLAVNLPVPSPSMAPFKDLSGPLKEGVNRITRLARHLFDVPISAVHLMEEQGKQFKSLVGARVIETPHDIPFYKYSLSQDDIFNVPEMLTDERFCHTPHILGGHRIRFYASCPFHLNHQKLGAISIADNKPRHFSKSHLTLLKDIAALIETELERCAAATDKNRLTSDLNKARLASMADPLTSLWNRQGMYNILKHRMDDYLLNGTGFSLAILDIDKFKKINDTYGHDAGDKVLITIAKLLLTGCRKTDAIGRWGGEEFLLLINEPNLRHAIDIAERIRTTIESKKVLLPLKSFIEVTATIGLTHTLPRNHLTLEQMIHKADQALYQGKRRGRNCIFSL